MGDRFWFVTRCGAAGGYAYTQTPASPTLTVPSASPLTAAVLHVGNSSCGQLCEDTKGYGNASNPFETIEYAIAQATPGAVVVLSPGIHR